MPPIKVLVVDDSALVRQVVTELLSQDPAVRVIGAAADPLFAMERMRQTWPDVIVLDIEMPRMDGITFLKKLMAERPTPVVVCSTLTEHGTETTMQAIAAGAVEILSKPKLGVKQHLQESRLQFLDAVKAAASAKVQRLSGQRVAPPRTAKPGVETGPPLSTQAMARTTERIVAIGTSTGGTQALEVVLSALPRVSPGLVIVQHMPEKFTAAFAARLDSLCAIEVREARPNDRVIPGRALIAPGGRHMLLKRSGAQYLVDVVDGPLVNRHRPSVDALFRSVAKYAGSNALGILMTGMGDDGASGLLEMRQAGAYTMAQDEATCVVYGMPKEAVKRGAAMEVRPLHSIAAAITADL